MFSSVGLLHFRKNEKMKPLQICWYKATMRNFEKNDIYKVSKREIDSIDIISLCNDIINRLFGNADKSRFSLYISSQLMYGTLKIFKQQILIAEVQCENLLSNIILIFKFSEGIKIKPKSTTKIINKNVQKNLEKLFSETLEEINIQNVFPQELPKDVHLIDEVDSLYQECEYQLSFGTVKNEENIEKALNQLHEEIMRSEKDTGFDSINTNVLYTRRASRNIISKITVVHNNEQHIQYKSTSKRTYQDVSKTPKNQGLLQFGLPQLSLVRLSTESAQTAFSPPTKRNLLSTANPSSLELSPLLINICESTTANNDSIMTVTEPILEAALPNILSPAELLMNTASTPPLVCEISDKFELSRISNTGKDSLKNDEIQIHVEAVNKNMKKLLRDKKSYQDIIKQIDIRMRNTDVFTTFKYKLIKKSSHNRKSAIDLLTLPSTLKKRAFNTKGRLWASRLINLYENNIQMIRENADANEFEDMAVDNKEINYLPKTIKKAKVVLERVDAITTIAPGHKVLEFDTQNLQECMNTDTQRDEHPNFVESDSIQNLSQTEEEQSMIRKSILNNFNKQEYNDDNEIIGQNMKKLKTSGIELESDYRDLNIIRISKYTNLSVTETELDYLTILEFFTFVKAFWKEIESNSRNKNKEIKVSFQEVVTPQNNRADEVVRYLMYCFELENKKKMELKQVKPYAPLYIIKPR